MNFFAIFDPMYWVFVGPAMLVAMWASWKTKSTFMMYANRRSSRGLTGAEAAYEMLQREGITNVKIERVQGFLSDHYDPRHRVLRLSPDVYSSNSLSAVGVACHEAGHAIQHANNYAPLAVRSALVPITNFSSMAWMFVLIAGVFLAHPTLVLAGVVLFSVSVVFSIVTLPVEWDASRRAKHAMLTQGLVGQGEEVHAGRVLDAAFMTYVASALTSIMTLLYYLHMLGLLGGRDD